MAFGWIRGCFEIGLLVWIWGCFRAAIIVQKKSATLSQLLDGVELEVYRLP